LKVIFYANNIIVHYVGTLTNGEGFDSSRDRDETFKFTLGQGMVIKGWDLGVATMNKGEKSVFTISHEYGYGSRGSGKIPANATLIFEVELINFYDKAKSIWEMDLPEKLHLATKCKDEGVNLFKEKKFVEAKKKFEEGLSYFEKLPDRDITDQVNEKKLSLLLNLSNCHNNLKEWQQTIKRVGEALKIKEAPKCYYYRGNAHMNLDEIGEAESDFLKLKELLPGDDSASACLEQLNQRRSKKEKMFKNMMKTSLYDDKEMPVTKIEKSIPKDVNPSNPRVYFEISIGGTESKRVEFELFKDVTPRTAENFRQLCVGPTSESKGYYKDSIFHRVIKDFMIQGGDFENSNGTGGRSIYGGKFEDENFVYKHTQSGLLSMANSGKDTNGSQFFVTLKETNWLDGKHVVFGRVIKGMEFIREIEKVSTNGQDRPNEKVKIVDCGEIKI